MTYSNCMVAVNSGKNKSRIDISRYSYYQLKPQFANQEMIANIAYANRYGNGGIESGDGWKYRGVAYYKLLLKVIMLELIKQ